MPVESVGKCTSSKVSAAHSLDRERGRNLVHVRVARCEPTKRNLLQFRYWC